MPKIKTYKLELVIEDASTVKMFDIFTMVIDRCEELNLFVAGGFVPLEVDDAENKES